MVGDVKKKFGSIRSFALFLVLAAAVFGGMAKIVTAASSPRISNGKEVTLAYTLSVKGTVLEIADAKNPFIYIHGKQQIVPGLEKGLDGLKVGDKKTIRVPPEQAYGPVDLKARREVPLTKLPPDVPKKVGTLVEARNPKGEVLLVKIVEVKKQSVVLDFNHPLAGRELEFQIEVLNIK